MRNWLNWDAMVEEARDLVEDGMLADDALVEMSMKYGLGEDECDRMLDEYYTKYYD